MIQAEHLVKRYGDKTALFEVSFRIGAGQVVGLLGLNGAGKSTTMNILTGYLAASSGRALIAGYDIAKQPKLAKRHIGYLPEQPAFYAGMRVREYLNFICDLKDLPREATWRREHINSLCERTGLSGLQQRLIRNLSKGYRQRVSFAQALAGDPSVLIMDEPTVGLDPSQILEIRALIKELGKTATVLISSHILSEIQELCTRVLVLKEGRLIADGSPQELAQRTRHTHHIRLRVRGTQEELQKALVILPGLQLHFLGSFEEQTQDVELIGQPGRDLREEAFRALATAGLPLLHSVGGEASLEDIFLRLVGKKEGSA